MATLGSGTRGSSPSTLEQSLEFHWRAEKVARGIFDELLSTRVSCNVLRLLNNLVRVRHLKDTYHLQHPSIQLQKNGAQEHVHPAKVYKHFAIHKMPTVDCDEVECEEGEAGAILTAACHGMRSSSYFGHNTYVRAGV